jgi:hypothetical protein
MDVCRTHYFMLSLSSVQVCFIEIANWAVSRASRGHEERAGGVRDSGKLDPLVIILALMFRSLGLMMDNYNHYVGSWKAMELLVNNRGQEHIALGLIILTPACTS